VCGVNLPAALLTGRPVGSDQTSDGFTRVVEEIATRDAIGLATYPWGASNWIARATKHPSGMRTLGRRSAPARRRTRPPETSRRPADRLAPHRATGPLEAPDDGAATPYLDWRPDVLEQRVTTLRESLVGLPRTTIAYSVKTAPHAPAMKLAAQLGLVAEVISMDEYSAACALGFEPTETILNGPAKWWPFRPEVTCDAFFADSLEELETLRDRVRGDLVLRARVVGVRLSRSDAPTRFGVRMKSRADLVRAAHLIRDVARRIGAPGWGVHFHLAQSVVGGPQWEAAASATLLAADTLAELIGTEPDVVDLGGGWHPDDLDTLRPSLLRLLAGGADCLRGDELRLVLEPGRALVQPTRSLICRVLGIRGHRGTAPDAVVDACLGDLPDARYRPHPVLRWEPPTGRWTPLLQGTGRVLGRSCMEDDVLATSIDLGAVDVGDYLAFADAGAYDVSMAFPFGRGETWGQR
jgi:diaminopimelate decarboxylase